MSRAFSRQALLLFRFFKLLLFSSMISIGAVQLTSSFLLAAFSASRGSLAIIVEYRADRREGATGSLGAAGFFALALALGADLAGTGLRSMPSSLSKTAFAAMLSSRAFESARLEARSGSARLLLLPARSRIQP